MWAQRHKHVYGTSDEDFGHIAITTRQHAERNEHATQRMPLTMDGYLAGRWIYEPFRVYDCCLETDGAAAIVITALDRARDLRHPASAAAGRSAGAHLRRFLDQPPDLASMYSAQARPRLWSRTALRRPTWTSPACTTASPIRSWRPSRISASARKGEVGRFFADGRATYGGDVVVNPHGGLLSKGISTV